MFADILSREGFPASFPLQTQCASHGVGGLLEGFEWPGAAIRGCQLCSNGHCIIDPQIDRVHHGVWKTTRIPGPTVTNQIQVSQDRTQKPTPKRFLPQIELCVFDFGSRHTFCLDVRLRTAGQQVFGASSKPFISQRAQALKRRVLGQNHINNSPYRNLDLGVVFEPHDDPLVVL